MKRPILLSLSLITVCPAAVALAALVACNRAVDEKPVPVVADAGDESVLTDGSNPLADLKSRLSQKQTPPPIDPDAAAPIAKRDPDWDLDRSDPARDYVRRYVVGVARYGTVTPCIEPQASFAADGKTEVRVADAVPPRCGPSGVDETFAVDVGADRLELVKQQPDRPKLKPWLDGSDPYAPAKTPVPEFADTNKWTAPTGQTLKKERLVPIRIQMYGRGTYPFVMLAGWPEWFPRTMSQAMRDGFAVKMCSGSQGMPLVIGAGLDRSNVLRIRCGANPTGVWEVL